MWNPIMVPKYNLQHSCYHQKKQMSLYCLSFESIGHSAGLFIQLYISPICTWLSMSDQDHLTLTCPTKPLLKIITHSSEAGAKRSQPKVENIHGVTVRLFAPVVSQNGVQEQNSSLDVCHSQTVAKLGFWSICAHMVSQYLPLTALVNGLTEKNWSWRGKALYIGSGTAAVTIWAMLPRMQNAVWNTVAGRPKHLLWLDRTQVEVQTVRGRLCWTYTAHTRIMRYTHTLLWSTQNYTRWLPQLLWLDGEFRSVHWI